MTLAFEATKATDLDDVAAFLITGFNSPPDAVFARPEVLRWKYFEPGPEWNSSRSYVLRQENRIKAHCGVWPMNLNFRGERIDCICFLDWLSEKDLPGAGVMLKKKLMRFAETSVVVGGSADTRAVVPLIGFQHLGNVTTFARVVRPWKQFRTRPREALGRGAARLLRNAAWSRTAGAIAPMWSIKRVKTFDELPEKINEGNYPAPLRDSKYLNYWLDTPAVDMAGFVILFQNEYHGYFLLSKVSGQARIADIRLLSNNVADWSAAYLLAASAAAEDPEICETVTTASTPLAREALVDSGFRDRGSVPLFLADRKKRLEGAPPIFLNMIDGDGAYLYDPSYPYVT
jgi:hypothetical protein